MATSGTVSTVVYRVRQIVDHAFRRAGFVPQKVSGEALTVALELLYSFLSERMNVGFPLWTRQYLFLPVVIGQPDVACPIGTVEVLHSYWRILQPYRGACTLSTSVGNATLFGGQANDDVLIAGPNPAVSVNFTTPTELDTIGVLLGNVAAQTVALQIQTSSDAGATWNTIQTLPSTTYNPLTWAYFDLSPTLVEQYVRILNPTGSSWTLNQLNFGLANGQDIEFGVQNIDDYYNLPNKLFRSDRPNTVFVDRGVEQQVLKIWPVPNDGAFYNGTVTALTRRYIQDPGTLRDSLEVPQRWIEFIQWSLAKLILYEIPLEMVTGDPQLTALQLQLREQKKQEVTSEALRAEKLAWGEERTRGPIRLTPSISPYTR
jgi:hypothetical protein